MGGKRVYQRGSNVAVLIYISKSDHWVLNQLLHRSALLEALITKTG